VATFSYEQALRNSYGSNSRPPADEACAPEIRPTVPLQKESPSESKLRRATSVTIRLTAIEAGQLHLRASEAGMTVSAYLRSCAFEVEGLRAEVKATLAQLRPNTAVPKEERNELRRRDRLAWLRFWSRLGPRLFRARRQA